MLSAAPKLEAVPDRDYAADMRAVIDAETAGGPYSSPQVAEHIVNKLRVTDPDLLDGWLNAQAVNFVRHAINLRDCSSRSHARMTSGRSVFAADAKLHEAGDQDAMSGWLDVVHPMDDGTRKRIADMTADDLLYVAADYDSRAKENLLHGAFLKAVAKKVRKGKVSDFFTDAKLAQLWRSISGQ